MVCNDIAPLHAYPRQARKQAERAAKAGSKGKAPAAAGPAEPGGMRQRDRVLSQVRAFTRLHPDDRFPLLTEKVRGGFPAAAQDWHTFCMPGECMGLTACHQPPCHSHLCVWYRRRRQCPPLDLPTFRVLRVCKVWGFDSVFAGDGVRVLNEALHT